MENPSEADALNEVKINHATPYPDFQAIEIELQEQKATHPLLLNANPVIEDIEHAALEGEMSAIEVVDLFKALKP